MTKQVQRRRGTSTQHTSFTGAEGEISVNTTNKSIHVHDGSTAGGVEAARADLTNVSDANLNAALSGNTLSSLTITSVDINGGTIDGAVIGGSSAAAGTFTTVTASGDLTIADKIVHSGDTNTAIRFPAADTVTVETSGVERLRVTSGGDVGIGTSSPSVRLDVRDSIASVSGAADSIAYFGNEDTTSTATTRITLRSHQGDSFRERVYLETGLEGVSGGYFSIWTRPTGSGITEKVRVTAAGNVGIGTASPAVALQVSGSIRTETTTPNIQFSETDTTDQNFGMRLSAGNMVFEQRNDDFSVQIAEYMRFTTAGDVSVASKLGIGTTSPAAQLHVSGTTTNTAVFTASISGTTMDVTAVTAGTIAVGDIVYGTGGVAPVTKILAFGTGTGGTGTYTVTVSQTVSSGTVYTASGTAATIRISDTDAGTIATQPQGTIEFFGSDSSSPGAGVGAYISAINENGTPDSALTFGTRDNAGGGVDANERMRITSSGNVGIGTTSPTTRLQVSAASSGATGVAGLNTLIVENSGAAGIAILTPNTDFGSIAFGDPENGAIGRIRYNHSTNDMTFNTNGSETVKITSTGNVGIGTSSPDAPLHLANGTSADFILEDSGASTLTDAQGKVEFQRSSNVAFGGLYATAGTTDLNISTKFSTGFLTFGTDTGGERMRITAAGNVGIGTTAPAVPLEIGGQATLSLRLLTTTNAVDFRIQAIGSSASTVLNNVSNHPLAIFTNNTERMRIDASGNVGIGTSSPTAAKLVITAGDTAQTAQFQGATGRIRVRGYQDATNGGIIDSTNTAENAYAPLTLQASALRLLGNNATGITIDASGNLGLGVTPSAWGNSGYAAINAKGNASFIGLNAGGTNTQTIVGNNWYDAGLGSPTYIASNFATNYTQVGGSHRWSTAPSGTAGNAITFTQAMTLDASGNLLVGTTSTSSAYSRTLAMSNGASVGISFEDQSIPRRFAIGTRFGNLVFDDNTAGSERARIDNAGRLLIGKTAFDNNAGVVLEQNGLGYFTRASSNPIAINRLTNDGVLIEFYQDTNLEGTISVSGTTVSYNGGHLSRWAQFPDNSRPELLKGTVMSNLDQMSQWGDEDNEQLNCVQVSAVEGDANVAGVFVAWDSTDDGYNDILLAMTGDMVIRIGAGVTVARGDLLMSAGDGTAQPQGDDIVRSKTIAKVTSTHVSHTYADGSYAVPCVLMAC